VLDTVDSLLSPLSSSSPFPQIIADTSLRISHHLVARAGTPLSAITEVRSHEQALGQSAAWLTANLPKAARVPWPSTAGALTSILDESTDTAGVAAICSRAAWERERARLELLCEGTQGVKGKLKRRLQLTADNFTRFVLLAREPTPIMTCAGRYARFFATRSPAIVGALSGVGELLSVHQRPAPAGTAATTFPRHMPRWTLVEVEAQPDAETPQGALDLGAVWTFEPAETEDTGVPEAELSDAAEQQFMGSGAL
jgi:prephenate dehydratase